MTARVNRAAHPKLLGDVAVWELPVQRSHLEQYWLQSMLLNFPFAEEVATGLGPSSRFELVRWPVLSLFVALLSWLSGVFFL